MSEVPVPPDLDSGPMMRPLKRIRHRLEGRLVGDPDPLDELPREEPMQQEFRLLAVLDQRVAEVARYNRRPVDLMQGGQIAAELGDVRRRIAERESPPNAPLVSPVDDRPQIGFQVNDRAGASSIGDGWFA